MMLRSRITKLHETNTFHLFTQAKWKEKWMVIVVWMRKISVIEFHMLKTKVKVKLNKDKVIDFGDVIGEKYWKKLLKDQNIFSEYQSYYFNNQKLLNSHKGKVKIRFWSCELLNLWLNPHRWDLEYAYYIPCMTPIEKKKGYPGYET